VSSGNVSTLMRGVTTSANTTSPMQDDFATEQATLAQGIAASVGSDGDGRRELLARLRRIQRPGQLAFFVHRDGAEQLETSDGLSVPSNPIIDAIEKGASSVRLTRDDAKALGLPARTALAGIANIGADAGHRWAVVTVATAERERDREIWARRRLVLSVLTTTALVLVVAGVSMNNQRKALVLEHDMALENLRRSRDEKLERASKSAAMGTLAMGVAHEISTPLGVIAARAEQMLPKVAGDERMTAGMNAILSQADRIRQVIRGLLDLARGDAPMAERIAPQAVVRAAVDLVEHRFNELRVPLARECDPFLPDVVGDPRLLEQAVVNLLLNACQACKSGGEVIAKARSGPSGVELIVEDSGVGISLADIDRAKEPFFSPREATNGDGTGLGLTIAHEIVASHRGKLEFSPRQPRGTTATIRLPPAEGPHNA
jgi:two-component system NtrC family sensor kinase